MKGVKNLFKKSNPDFFYSITNTIIILLVLNLLSNNLGYFDIKLMNLVSLFLILGFVIFNVPFKKILFAFKKDKVVKTVIGLIQVFISFLVMIFSNSQILWIASVALLIFGLDLLLQNIQIYRREMFLLGILSFVYCIFYMLVYTISYFWILIQQFSFIITKSIGLVLNKELIKKT